MIPFDPYHTWLGIAPEEQPADYYRLLGIRRFEEKSDVISHAADRQMAHLKTFQIGARASDCQRLLNEVSAASTCLLDPDRKAAYDASIRPANIVPMVSRSVKRTQSRPYSTSAVVQIIVGGGAGIFVAILVLNYFWGIDLLGKAKKLEPAKAANSKPSTAETASTKLPRKSAPQAVKKVTGAKVSASTIPSSDSQTPIPKETSSPLAVQPGNGSEPLASKEMTMLEGTWEVKFSNNTSHLRRIRKDGSVNDTEGRVQIENGVITIVYAEVIERITIGENRATFEHFNPKSSYSTSATAPVVGIGTKISE